MTNNEKQRVTLFINPSLLKQAKGQSIAEEISLTALMEKALNKYLPKETIIKQSEIKADFDHLTHTSAIKAKRGKSAIK